MYSATEGWAVGTGTSALAAMLRWDGTLRASVPSGAAINGDLYSVHMLASNDGWAVGTTGFSIESILAGLLGGLIALTVIRRRRRL